MKRHLSIIRLVSVYDLFINDISYHKTLSYTVGTKGVRATKVRESAKPGVGGTTPEFILVTQHNQE